MQYLKGNITNIIRIWFNFKQSTNFGWLFSCMQNSKDGYFCYFAICIRKSMHILMEYQWKTSEMKKIIWLYLYLTFCKVKRCDLFVCLFFSFLFFSSVCFIFLSFSSFFSFLFFFQKIDMYDISKEIFLIKLEYNAVLYMNANFV